MSVREASRTKLSNLQVQLLQAPLGVRVVRGCARGGGREHLGLPGGRAAPRPIARALHLAKLVERPIEQPLVGRPLFRQATGIRRPECGDLRLGRAMPLAVTRLSLIHI